ncbi:hypothetical protein ACFL6C_11000 [Myxococcota bacterium]
MTARAILAATAIASMLACRYNSPVVSSAGQKVTLTLTQDSEGNLDCSAPANLECEDLPYSGDCAVIEVDVNTATGQTCQRCIHADGTVVDEGCANTSIGCVLVTLPDPDCVVCAYFNGAVVFSTCVPQEPEECVAYQRSDGSQCERCFDPGGRIVFDSCLPDCSDVACRTIGCGSSSELRRVPGECCEQCVPIDSCDEVVCPTDYPIPDCPEGTILTRDPIDCCAYFCEPTECPPMEDRQDPGLLPPQECNTHTDCPERAMCINGFCEYDGTGACPPGFLWIEEFPYCGQCVEWNDDRFCFSDVECFSDEICVFEDGICGSTVPPEEPGGSGSAGDPDEDKVCYGVCRPMDPICEPTDPVQDPTFAPCDGEWIIEYDSNGCPFPICGCPDGSVSLDGLCRDQCDTVDCTAVLPPDCGPDFYIGFFYPHCCGVCVPHDPCAYAEGETNPNDPSAPVLTCEPVSCAPGYLEEIDQGTCCPICVPEQLGMCTSSAECQGRYCSVDDGVCNPPPDCDPDQGSNCTGVCYGECVPFDNPRFAECDDSDGGIDPDTTGEVTFSDVEGHSWTEVDRCTDDGTAVIEFYCTENADGRFVEEIVIECQDSSTGGGGGCWDGACR